MWKNWHITCFVEYSAKITFLTEIYKIYLLMSIILLNFAAEYACVYFMRLYTRNKECSKYEKLYIINDPLISAFLRT